MLPYLAFIKVTKEKGMGILACEGEVFKVAWASCPCGLVFIITCGTPVPRQKSGMGILPMGLRFLKWHGHPAHGVFL